ncbi:MAG TPA: 5-oxoprolinase subunit PxpB [Rhodanobacteraceae bacterium]|nr:5-oxoprolinase subunit PxpB [Rhodanobacteraceae bacterium]
MDFAIEPVAEDTVLLRFGDAIDANINARVHAAAHTLRTANLAGIIDIAPAYATLLVRFDPAVWLDTVGARPLEHIATSIRSVVAGLPLSQADASLGGRGWGKGAKPSQAADAGCARSAGCFAVSSLPSHRPGKPACVVIPVCYGGEYGPDLDAIAAHARLAPDDIVARHGASDYTVAMLGFAPGFPYLLGLDPVLHMPRRANPRTRVPAGSVAIGGAQTGIYPRELPGGWHLIGRTPLALFTPRREPPCVLAPGDRVCFRAIDADEFTRLSKPSA